MQMLENDSTALSCVIAGTDASAGNYGAVRFNAIKHGVLSKLTVLAHEDHAEFDELLAAPLVEHQPAGMT